MAGVAVAADEAHMILSGRLERVTALATRHADTSSSADWRYT
jgi:hypothetical protein